MDMSTNLRRAALFDLDGVLIDTEPAYTAFWRRVGAVYRPDDPKFAERLKGHTLTDIFAEHFADDAAAREHVGQLLREQEAAMDYPLMGGALGVVEQLRSEGLKTAVVTSSDRAKMARLYGAHPDFPSLFDAVFTAEDVRRSKPAPDCYLHAAAALGCDIGDCLVFEDSMSGLQAARSSGAFVVGLATSHRREQIEARCDLVVDSWADFKAAWDAGRR